MSAMSQGILRTYGENVVTSWLQEFGYLFYANVETGIHTAMQERGPRWKRELDAHGKRLADRAQMAARPMQGRAGVIR